MIGEIESNFCWMSVLEIRESRTEDTRNLRKCSLTSNLNKTSSNVSEDKYSKVENKINKKNVIKYGSPLDCS